MQTRRFSGLHGLRELRDSWISLHQGANLYARYEWHWACAAHLLKGATSLDYLQVKDGERIVAILPIIASIAQVPLYGRMRVLSVGLHDHLKLADLPLAEDAQFDRVASAIRDELCKWPEHWDAILWPRALSTSNLMRLARSYQSPNTFITPAAPCNTIDTQRSYDVLFAGLSKNLKASLRKSQKRLADSGDVQVTRNGVSIDSTNSNVPDRAVDREEGIAWAFEQFLTLEASGWKGDAGTGSAISLEPALRKFYAELLAQRALDFVTEVTVLARNSSSVAAQFSVSVNECKQILKIGYDESNAKFSPGQVLMARVLEAATISGLRRISLVTDMPWHQTWHPLPEPTFCVTVFRRRWRALVFRVYVAIRRAAKAALLAMSRRRRNQL